MLKTARKNTLINKALRNPLKKWLHFSKKMNANIQHKWRPSGIITCDFDGISFNMYSECDDGIVDYLFYHNAEYPESQDLRVFMSLAKASGVIIDIGANTGVYSILSSKVNPKAKIFSVEPYLSNFVRLEKNIKCNNLQNVEAVNIAIGENDGHINFFVPNNNAISDVSSVNGNFSKSIYPDIKWVETKIPINTLDLFSKRIAQRINLVKCDVESYEMSVFKGATEVLKTHKPTILFESFIDAERKAFFDQILSINQYYAYMVLRDGLVRLDNGLQANKSGLNFLISPIKSTENFLSHEQIEGNPLQLLYME
jgi:FkbM family methyltransferase